MSGEGVTRVALFFLAAAAVVLVYSKLETAAPPPPRAATATADDAGSAIAALDKHLVHVGRLSEGSPLLWLDFTPADETLDGAEIAPLLRPLADRIAELSLPGRRVTESLLAVIRDMPELERLDLRRCTLPGSGLAALRGHEKLSTIVLVQTRLNSESMDALGALPALKKAYLWGSTADALACANLRATRTSLVVDNDADPAAALETEAPPKLKSDAPAVDSRAADAVSTPAAAPANTLCPVTGRPIDASHRTSFEGRTIGFCCPKCTATFLADPEKYRSKL